MFDLTDLLYSLAPNIQYVSFLLLILAGFNLPFSEDLIFIISASIAATIIPENTVVIFIGCFAGAYLSDIIAYLIGWFAGDYVLNKKKIIRTRHLKKMEKIEQYFEKYGILTLFFGRFIPFGVRNLLFITAGIAKVRTIKFLVVDLSALLISSTILFTSGFMFGKNFHVLIEKINKYKIVILYLFIAIAIITISYKMINKYKKKAE